MKYKNMLELNISQQNVLSEWNKIRINRSISRTDLFAAIFVYLTSIRIYDPFYGTRLSLLGIGNILSTRGQINWDGIFVRRYPGNVNQFQSSIY